METNNQKLNKKLGIAGKMASLFVKNPQINMLAIFFIIVTGIASFIIIPKTYNPDIVAPAFIITTPFSGANANEVYDLITRPMEDVIKELPNIDKLSSKSFDGGKSFVMVQFKVGTPAEDAKISLNQKINDNLYKKPIGAENPFITTIDPEDVPVISIAITSKEHSPEALRKLAFEFAEKIKNVDGASKVEVIGGRSENLNIYLSPEKMNALNISINEIINTLKSSNGIYTAEKIENDKSTETIRINGNTSSIEDVKNIIVRSNIRLADIAEITKKDLEISNDITITNKNGDSNQAAYISIAKLKGSNITTVTKNISEKLEDIKKENLFSMVNFSIMHNDGEVAREAIFTLTEHLILSVVIVVIVLMLFLGLRNALIVAIAIPLTLLASFVVGLFFDQTINRITLFALILALGLLVDDAIVIIENIHRSIKNNPQKKLTENIISAVDEVGMGVFMSTITILLAFIPMSFVGGMMGPYMAPIPFFVSVTLLASLFIAFTINPALTAIFSAKNHVETENVFVRLVHKLENSYAKLIEILVNDKKKKNKVLIGSIVLLFFAILLPIFKVVQFRMLPKADKNQFYVYIDMPSGEKYEKTTEISKKIEAEILKMNNTESVESFIGTPPIADFNGLFKGSFMRSAENQATLKINLLDHKKRSATSEEIAMTFRENVTKNILENNPNIKITVVEDPPGPPVKSTFFIKVQGSSQNLIENVTKDIEIFSRKIDGIEDLNTTISQRGFEKLFSVNNEKANSVGISSAQIIQTLHIAFSGENIARYSNTKNNIRQMEQEFVFLKMSKDDMKDSNSLSNIMVTNMQGKNIPISELLDEQNYSNYTEIGSDEREKTIYISGEMGKRSVMYAILDLFPKLFSYKLPDQNGKIISWSPLKIIYQDNSGEKISISLDGEWKLTLEIFRDLGIAMGMALVLIYFVLVIQLKSLVSPLLIMATIPLALIGVLFGFAILAITKGTYFNATSMIGVIALAGIVVKNAIIYLAYLDELKESGFQLNKALMEAGRVRLLPIALTSLTAILGSLTIVADPVWEGLAWAIIFGLSVSTVLTLIIFPLLYQTFEGKKWNN